jgi:hypothetical protein
VSDVKRGVEPSGNILGVPPGRLRVLNTERNAG